MERFEASPKVLEHAAWCLACMLVHARAARRLATEQAAWCMKSKEQNGRQCIVQAVVQGILRRKGAGRGGNGSEPVQKFQCFCVQWSMLLAGFGHPGLGLFDLALVNQRLRGYSPIFDDAKLSARASIEACAEAQTGCLRKKHNDE